MHACRTGFPVTHWIYEENIAAKPFIIKEYSGLVFSRAVSQERSDLSSHYIVCMSVWMSANFPPLHRVLFCHGNLWCKYRNTFWAISESSLNLRLSRVWIKSEFSLNMNWVSVWVKSESESKLSQSEFETEFNMSQVSLWVKVSVWVWIELQSEPELSLSLRLFHVCKNDMKYKQVQAVRHLLEFYTEILLLPSSTLLPFNSCMKVLTRHVAEKLIYWQFICFWTTVFLVIGRFPNYMQTTLYILC